MGVILFTANQLPKIKIGTCGWQSMTWVFGHTMEKITHYPIKDSFKGITLFTIYKDKYGDLWLGTFEKGAYKFNDNSFEKFKP